MWSYLNSAAGLALILATHFFAGRVRRERRFQAPLMNIIAGIAIAYAFIDVYPHLARQQLTMDAVDLGPITTYLTHHAYLMALLGFCVYVGMRVLNNTAKVTRARIAYSGVLASMCLYAGFIGYMLAEQPLYRPQPALLFGLAMSAHFLGIDHSLSQERHANYDGVVRYLLIGFTTLGWLGGFLYTISEIVYALAFAYIAGGIVAVSAISDRARIRTSRDFLGFLAGVVLYSCVLLALEAYRAAGP